MDVIGNRTVRDLWRERAGRRGESTFLVHEDRHGRVQEYTYAESLHQIRRIAAGLARRELGKDDAVVLHLANGPDLVFCWFALMWIGAVPVLTDVTGAKAELEHVMNVSEAVAVVTGPEHLELARTAAMAGDTVDRIVLTRADDGPDDVTLLRDVRASQPIGHSVPIRPDHVAELVMSRPRRGKPKAIMLTHANCLYAGEQMARALALDRSDRLLSALPLADVSTQAGTVLAALTIGGTAILLEEFKPDFFMSQARAHAATAITLVTELTRPLLTQPVSVEDHRHRIRRCFYPDHLSDAEKAEFEHRFGIELTRGFGLGEAMMMVTMAPVYGERRWPSVGLPVAGRQVRIVDRDGEDVAPGTPGELICSGMPGRTVLKGYLGDPETTRATVRDGWLYTKQEAYFDEYGYVYLNASSRALAGGRPSPR